MKFTPAALILGCTVWGFAFPPDSQAHIALDGDQVVLESVPRTDAWSWTPVPDAHLTTQPDEVENNEDNTIYHVLKSYPGFSKLLKAVDYVDDIATILKDSSANITFFAFDNHAVKPHPRHSNSFMPYEFSLATVLEEIENKRGEDTVEDNDRKKLIKQVLREVLSYHILPSNINARSLSSNISYPTLLKPSDGSFAGQSRRIRVTGHLLRKKTTINFYSTFKKADIAARNGMLHVISLPLIPPFSILEQGFFLQRVASTSTSLLQKVNLSQELEYRIYPAMLGLFNQTTAPAVTAFVPINTAWNALPKGLQLYLFSPFGARALKKLLQFHIVPNHIVHSEFFYNASTEAKKLQDDQSVLISSDYVNALHWGEDAIDKELFGAQPFFARPTNPYRLVTSPAQRPPVKCEILEANYIVNNHIGKNRIPPPIPFDSLIRRGKACAQIHDNCNFPKVHHDHIPPPPCHPGSPGRKPPHWPPNHPPPPQHPLPCKGFTPPHQPPPGLPTGTPPGTPPDRHLKPILNETFVLPTLLANHTIKFEVLKYKVPLVPPNLGLWLKVNGRSVVVSDIPARNGVYHYVPRLISPRHSHRHREAGNDEDSASQDWDSDQDWEEWRDWLPQWAEED